MQVKLAWAEVKNGRKPVQTAKGPRYQVRWEFTIEGRRPKERCRTDFRTLAEADAFVDMLRKANFRLGDWHFDADGDPVEGTGPSETVLSAAIAYVEARWYTDWQNKQRDKVRGRLIRMIIFTLARSVDQSALLAAYDSQRNDRGQRREPTTTIEWAGRWLRDIALVPHVPEPTDEHLLAGRHWIEQRSIGVTTLDDTTITQLRKHFTVGLSDATARTYWQGAVVPFLNWLVDTRQITHRPLAGQSKILRDTQAERPDRLDILEPDELALVAAEMGARHGTQWELWTLVTGLCALRLGESLAVRLTSFRRQPNGRWVLDIREQQVSHTRHASDFGESTRKITRPKSRRHSTPEPRHIPVPEHLVGRLIAHYGDQLGTSNRHAFNGPRGAIGNQPTVRGWWHEAVAATFGPGHRLIDKNPHVLRHSGMTYWFAAGTDHARVRSWGGWKSVKEMLDTYRGVIASLEEEELEHLDQFHARWIGEPASTESGVVIALDSHRGSKRAAH